MRQELGAHAITLNAYMGVDTVKPFLTNSGRGVFVLCKVKGAAGHNIVCCCCFFCFSYFSFLHGIVLKKMAGVELKPRRLDHTLSAGNETVLNVLCVWMDSAAVNGEAAFDDAGRIRLIDDFDLAP